MLEAPGEGEKRGVAHCEDLKEEGGAYQMLGEVRGEMGRGT